MSTKLWIHHIGRHDNDQPIGMGWVKIRVGNDRKFNIVSGGHHDEGYFFKRIFYRWVGSRLTKYQVIHQHDAMGPRCTVEHDDDVLLYRFGVTSWCDMDEPGYITPNVYFDPMGD